MSRRKKIAIDAIVDEMSAVAAFARSSPSPTDGSGKEPGQGPLVTTLLRAPTAALPRERRAVAAGKYQVAAGWDAEPAIEGQRNAASIRIVRADPGPPRPVEGAEATLKVSIRHGEERRELPLRPVLGQRGHYLAHVVPTRGGDYEFALLGTLEGEPVDERFDSAAGQLAGVEPAAGVQVPVRSDEPARLAAAVREARALAAAGLGVGLLGLLVALASWRARGKAQPEARAAGAPADLGPDFGRALQAEIARALEPLLAEFRQQLAQAVRAQAERAATP